MRAIVQRTLRTAGLESNPKRIGAIGSPHATVKVCAFPYPMLSDLGLLHFTLTPNVTLLAGVTNQPNRFDGRGGVTKTPNDNSIILEI
jgi:hypothetical protein